MIKQCQKLMCDHKIHSLNDLQTFSNHPHYAKLTECKYDILPERLCKTVRSHPDVTKLRIKLNQVKKELKRLRSSIKEYDVVILAHQKKLKKDSSQEIQQLIQYFMKEQHQEKLELISKEKEFTSLLIAFPTESKRCPKGTRRNKLTRQCDPK